MYVSEDKKREIQKVDRLADELVDLLLKHKDNPTMNEGMSALFTALNRITFCYLHEHPEYAPSLLLSVNQGADNIANAIERKYMERTGKRLQGR